MSARKIDALDRNYRLASAEVLASSETGSALETRDVHCVHCGLPVAEFNWAFLKLPGQDPSRVDRGEVERAADRAERYFGDLGSPFRFIVRADLAPACETILTRRGHRRLPKTTPGMSMDPLRPAPPPPAALRIVRVASPAELADFQRTAFAGFGLPVALGSRFLTDRLLELPETALFVGYVGEAPVSTAVLMATGPIAGIYWVSTLESERRKGYAAAVAWAALEAGREIGCTTGSLQASELGRPVYEKMGFVMTAQYALFQRPGAR